MPHRHPMYRVPIPGGALGFNRTLIMGVLNVTPDSFSDGGHWLDSKAAIRHGLAMAKAGADIIDVGGASSRPGAPSVDPDEEIHRVLPVIRALARRNLIVSIDTFHAVVAQAAFEVGAKILNDISALADPAMAPLAARAQVGVILMHMQGTPQTMQKHPRYRDVVREILTFLRRAIEKAVAAGIDRRRIIIDPGIGFGKTPAHNIDILRNLATFRRLRCPIAIGTSRKRFIGHYLDRPVAKRLWGTAATLTAAILRGVHLVRVHDVAEMADVARMSDVLK